MTVQLGSVGARGPLGFSSLQVAMCARANKLEPRALQWRDKRNQEMAMCFTGGLPKNLYGYHRMVKLAAPALHEATGKARERLGGSGPLAAIPIVLSAPAAGRPDDDPRFDSGEMLRDVAVAAGVDVDLPRSVVVRGGQASFANALMNAEAILANGAEAVAVGGVDSYYHEGVLRWLDDEYRLMSPESENGFIPSEAGAWLVLCRQTQDIQLAALEMGTELSVTSDQPNLAETLTELMVQAKAKAGMPDWALTDLNGERHRHDEFFLAHQRQLPHEMPLVRPAGDVGDVGAATGALYSVLAAEWWRRGEKLGSLAQLALCSEGPQRAVLSWRFARR